MTKYRCGFGNWPTEAWSAPGCGETFTEDEFDGFSCPKCDATFCGDECCGNMFEVIEEENTK